MRAYIPVRDMRQRCRAPCANPITTITFSAVLLVTPSSSHENGLYRAVRCRLACTEDQDHQGNCMQMEAGMIAQCTHDSGYYISRGKETMPEV